MLFGNVYLICFSGVVALIVFIGEYCALDSFADFGAIYIVSLFTSYASPLVLFSSLFSLLIYSLIFSFHNRPALFQAGGQNR